MFEYLSYNIAAWGSEVSLYFLLIGMAAVTFILSAAPSMVAGFSTLLPLQKAGTIATLALVVISIPLLIADLGQPARFLYVLFYVHASAPLTWGSWLLVLFGLSAAGFLFVLYTGREGWKTPLAVVGSLFALGMPLYTGADLMVNQARELWNSPVIPVLFVALSLTSGAALMAVLALSLRHRDAVGVLRRVLFVSLGSTLVLFVLQVLQLSYGTGETQAVWMLINTEFGAAFWGWTLVVGILLPLGGLVVPRLARQSVVVVAAGIAGTIGAFTYRDVIILAGQLPQAFY